MKPKTELAIDCAKFAISDEGVFSPDQIKLLEDMIGSLAVAIETQAVTPVIIDVSHKLK